MNDLVDQLAVRAAQVQQAESGEGVPVVDVSTLDPRVPPGHRLVGVGHRPPALGGYDDNPIAADVRRRLTEIVAGKLEVHGDLMVLTGLGLGAEQLVAEAAIAAGAPFAAVLPYPDQDSVWPSPSREKYPRAARGGRPHGRPAGSRSGQPPAGGRRALPARRVAGSSR